MPFEIEQGEPGQLGLLDLVHIIRWIAGVRFATGFHFHKNHGPAIDRHQIKFAQPAALLPGDDLQTTAITVEVKNLDGKPVERASVVVR